MLRRIECSGVLQNGSFFFPLIRSTIFSLFCLCFFLLQYYYGNLFGVLKIKLTKVWGPPYNWIFMKFLALRFVYTEPLPNIQLQVRFSHLGSGFHSWVFALVNYDSQYLLDCLSNLWGSSFLCVLTFLPHQIIVDFQSFQLFIHCYNGIVTTKTLSHRTGDWKFYYNIFYIFEQGNIKFTKREYT